VGALHFKKWERMKSHSPNRALFISLYCGPREVDGMCLLTQIARKLTAYFFDDGSLTLCHTFDAETRCLCLPLAHHASTAACGDPGLPSFPLPGA